MLNRSDIMRMAGDKKINPTVISKDYALGWLLFGICESSIGNKLIFKGGTSLSKIYFPGNWRLSEDLDFTIFEEIDSKSVEKVLETEVPSIIKDKIGMEVRLKKRPHHNEGYLQSKFQYDGPLGKDTVKLEITKENKSYDFETCKIPQNYDYPEFAVQVYSLNEILAEKMRSMVQRRKIRDYYDVWRLLKTLSFDKEAIKKIFLEKMKIEGTPFTSIDQFFPDGIIDILRPFLETGLTRLSSDNLPTLETMLEELRDLLTIVLS